MYTIIWSLLPIVILGLSMTYIGAWWLKKPSGRFFLPLLKQFIFTGILLFVSIWIDRHFDEDIKRLDQTYQFLRWLIYPVLLLFGAKIQQFFEDKKTTVQDREKKIRQSKYGA